MLEMLALHSPEEAGWGGGLQRIGADQADRGNRGTDGPVLGRTVWGRWRRLGRRDKGRTGRYYKFEVKLMEEY